MGMSIGTGRGLYTSIMYLIEIIHIMIVVMMATNMIPITKNASILIILIKTATIATIGTIITVITEAKSKQ